MLFQFHCRLREHEQGAATTEFTDRLYGRIGDATVVSRAGVVFVGFDREAESLEEALRAGIAGIRAAGGTVVEIILEPAEVARWETLPV